ncbi:hypothetical protein AnigIFM63309_003421 [Aspergillus niger]|nr:hypothetical protein AnigIFM63309_003421 [Aspergillus niger]
MADTGRTPAGSPPPGVTPNFVNAPGSEYQIYSVSIGLCAAATLVLIVRLYTRAFILKNLHLDDACCVMGQLCAWIFAILSIINVKNGYGVHIWDLYLDQLTAFKKKYDLAEEDVYSLGVWFVKTSILLFYLRLSPEKRFRQITYAIMAFVAAYSLTSILVFTLGCQPVAAMWDVSKSAGAKCVDQFSFVYANAAFNVFSDVIILILPIRLCWSLQVSWRQKTMLLMLFILGSFACIVSCVRIITMMPFIHSSDFTWYKVTLATWCMVEINVGIICACLPVMRPLFLQTFPRLFSSIGSRNTSGNQQSSENSYQLKKPARKIRNWDYLTTLHTQLTNAGRDQDGDAESAQAIVRDESGEQNGIVKSVNYTVQYKDQK